MGLKLASGGSDGVVVVLSKRGDDTWDKPYKFEAHQQGINQLVWAPFTHTTTFYKHTQRPLQWLATVSNDTTMKLWLYDYDKKVFEE